jgi:hypothetical protein
MENLAHCHYCHSKRDDFGNAFRAGLQICPPRASALARRLGRCFGDGSVVQHRKVCDRATIWERALLRPSMELQAPSSFCCYGRTTRLKYFSLAPKSPEAILTSLEPAVDWRPGLLNESPSPLDRLAAFFTPIWRNSPCGIASNSQSTWFWSV